jgi:hypothetical protein
MNEGPTFSDTPLSGLCLYRIDSDKTEPVKGRAAAAPRNCAAIKQSSKSPLMRRRQLLPLEHRVRMYVGLCLSFQHVHWMSPSLPHLAVLVLSVCIPSSLGLHAQTIAEPPASAAPPEDRQWVMPAKNFASTRYSGFDEINAGNASNIQLAFTFSTGSKRGLAAAPLVVNNTITCSPPIPTHCTRSI